MPADTTKSNILRDRIDRAVNAVCHIEDAVIEDLRSKGVTQPSVEVILKRTQYAIQIYCAQVVEEAIDSHAQAINVRTQDRY
jgi:hypothetical protein